MRVNRGLILSFEGCDGVGKTTQCKLLQQLYKDRCVVFSSPNRTTTTGLLLNSFLKGELQLSARVSQCIFVANQWEQYDLIVKSSLAGNIVILDRAVHSSIVYGVTKGLDYDWCCSLQTDLIYPDLSILLMRSNISYTTKEIYDNVAIQTKILSEYMQYKDLKRLYCHEQINSTHKEIVNMITPYLSKDLGEIKKFTKLLR